MREKLNVPENYYFRHMQLVHALVAQFPDGIPQLIETGLEQLVRKRKENGLISTLYTHLVKTEPSDMNKLCECWLRDVPKLSSENCGEIYKFTFQILVSLGDKLIQFKITHRS